MKYIDPINTTAWLQLKEHFNQIGKVHMKDLFFHDANRFDKFSVNFEDQIIVDFSKNRITDTTMTKLLKLTDEMKLSDAINDMFSGKKINYTENQPVLHVALRNNNKDPIIVNKTNVMLKIDAVLKKIKFFSELVISGKWTGFSNMSITDVVNIGIGGSDLGPNMVTDSLEFYKNHLKVHYVSNIDGSHLSNVLKHLNPESTLFIIVSKTFNTQETMINANSARKWLLNKFKDEKCISKHFCAVSTNLDKPIKFGISYENIFEIWHWVGGRYSLWSAVGLSIVLSIGFSNFKKFLSGAYSMDQHFLKTDFRRNIPVLLALISIWYNNFFKTETEAILPYDQSMSRFPKYLQQANMESNGKSVSRNAQNVLWQTGPIIWGEPGTNAQHAFFQLLHQGTKLVPCDFIGTVLSHYSLRDHHKVLLSNFFAQTQALAFGTNDSSTKDIIFKHRSIPFKLFKGNKPTNSLLLKKVTPYTLGALIALYEHKIFTQGIIFNIFSFDQWGVELGKSLANNILNDLSNNEKTLHYDTSTNNLINYYKNWS